MSRPLLLGVLALALAMPAAASAHTFAVDTTQDAVDAAPGDGTCATAGGACALRAAIQEANALPGRDVVTIPAGTYSLARGPADPPGDDRLRSASGDLDVTGDTTIRGAGMTRTTIDAAAVDRVLHLEATTPAQAVTLEDLAVTGGVRPADDGTHPGFGGGVYTTAATTLRRVAVRDNTAAGATSTVQGGYGGGIYSDESLALDEVLIAGNRAARGGVASKPYERGGGSYGGGVVAFGTLTVDRSAFVDNVADAWSDGMGGLGGGLYTEDDATVANTTFSGNRTTGFAALGGGIFALRGTFTHVTVSGNAAGRGGGLFAHNDPDPPVTLANSVVSGNAASEDGANCAQLAPLVSAGGNVATAECGIGGAGADPRLGPLADNGGRTPTHALGTGSAALDAATAAACTPHDQRGRDRPGGRACDAGAFERTAADEPRSPAKPASDTAVPAEQVRLTLTARRDRVAAGGEAPFDALLVAAATGRPVPGVPIRFAVASGPGRAAPARCAPSCTTSAAGGASWSVGNGREPGTDAVTAFADLDGDGQAGPGEPAARAEVLWIPTRCDLAGAGGWAMRVEASGDDGLVASDVRLGPRTLARRLSLPYFELDLPTGPQRGELTLDDARADPRRLSTRLVDLRCVQNDREVLAEAQYALTGTLFPGGARVSGDDVRITQRYLLRRRRAGDLCEPSAMLPCARFWPTAGFALGPAALDVRSVRFVQRLEFAPDGTPGGTANMFHDRSLRGGLASRQGVATRGEPVMKWEDADRALRGGREDYWDNFHQSARPVIGLPGATSPGCSECVHLHWHWSGAVNTFSRGFTDELPLLRRGSQLTGRWAVTRREPLRDGAAESERELDPVERGYEALVDRDRRAGRAASLVERDRDGHLVARPVFWFDSRSPGAPLAGGRRGDEVFPDLRGEPQHGGSSSGFFAPAERLAPASDRGPLDGRVVVEPRWALLRGPGRGRPGWTLPVDVRLDARRCLAYDLAWSPDCGSEEGRPRLRGPLLLVARGGGASWLDPDPAFRRLPLGDPFALVADGDGHPVAGLDYRRTIRRGSVTLRSEAGRVTMTFDRRPDRATLRLALVRAPAGGAYDAWRGFEKLRD